MSDAMMAEWVVGRFEGGRARSVIEHGDAGIGYIILERGGSRANVFCMAAFRRPCDRPRPSYLEPVVDPVKFQEYENIRKARQGIR